MISYANFSQLLLGVTAIAVALFAIAVTVVGAIFGFLGYRSIQRSASSAAERAAAEKLEEYFGGQDLPGKIDEAIRNRIALEVDLFASNPIAYVTHDDPGGLKEGRVADDYPDK